MTITFLGHAAFLVETNGTRVILDPYLSDIGYDPIHQSADIVTVSHDNPRYHSGVGELLGSFELLDGLQLAGHEAQHRGIRFGAIQVYENLPDDGPNAMVWLQSEGLRVLHMGDLGHPLGDDMVQACGRVDVLLALAGGAPTLALPDLVSFIERLRPRFVLPMHYGVPGLSMRLLPLDDLLSLFSPSQVQLEPGSTLEVSRDALPEGTTVVALQPARLRAA